MTLDEFIDQVREETRQGVEWKLDRFGKIRTAGKCRCPILAVADMDFDVRYAATVELGLSKDDMLYVMNAADGDVTALRTRLLDACNLSREEAARTLARDFARAAVGL